LSAGGGRAALVLIRGQLLHLALIRAGLRLVLIRGELGFLVLISDKLLRASVCGQKHRLLRLLLIGGGLLRPRVGSKKYQSRHYKTEQKQKRKSNLAFHRTPPRRLSDITSHRKKTALL